LYALLASDECEQDGCGRAAQDNRHQVRILQPGKLMAFVIYVGIVALNIFAYDVNRVWTKKALWCTRMHPDDIRKIHIADLRTKFGNQGLDIVGESCYCV
jgi:hypothetical protein